MDGLALMGAGRGAQERGGWVQRGWHLHKTLERSAKQMAASSLDTRLWWWVCGRGMGGSGLRDGRASSVMGNKEQQSGEGG